MKISKSYKRTQTQKIDNKQQFDPKIKNLTHIQLTENKTVLLSKGLEHNIHCKSNNWIRTLAIETETAISYTRETEQNYLRHATAKTIKHLFRKKQHNGNLNDIKKKITEHKLIIQADKGKTIVIMQEQDYNKIINDFLQTNKFMHITQIPFNLY
jgi:HD-GYP domain-containing protein (c-di-GMP phosphodiesterase class II)